LYTIVIVDDEEFILEQISQTFPWGKMGFSLAGCFTGAEGALEFMRQTHADVLLTDIQLGLDNGLDLANKAREINADLEIVLLSAHSKFEYAHTALRIRVFEYLVKPVTFQSVTECFAALKEKLDMLRGTQPEENSEDYRIELVKRHIDRHIGDNLSLESLAETVGMNPAYFSRFFKRHTGVLFADYLAECRMKKAIELLREPRHKVFEICTMVGYYSKQNFYRRFRAFTGHTPAEYRNDVLKIEDDDDEA
jgi:Response regulator containing CheY-like receiver domain and AraC-type DNA-binding domain